MRERLEALRDAGRPAAVPHKPTVEQSIDELAELLHRGVPRSTKPKPVRAARAAVLRAISPYVRFQRKVDETTIHVLRHAVGDLERRRDAAASAEAAAQAALLAANRQLERRLAEEAERTSRALQFATETRARPFMAGDPLETFDGGTAGRVLGWRTADDSAQDYASFEDVFRGTEEFIRDRQRRYVDVLRGHEPILDLGCGRGEFLDLARETGLDASGIDLDESMVERARAKGLDGRARRRDRAPGRPGRRLARRGRQLPGRRAPALRAARCGSSPSRCASSGPAGS